jgi:hypothetical protein
MTSSEVASTITTTSFVGGLKFGIVSAIESPSLESIGPLKLGNYLPVISSITYYMGFGKMSPNLRLPLLMGDASRSYR